MASYSAVATGIHHKVLMGLNLKQSRHRGHNGSPLHTSLSRGSARACHETSSHSRAACKPLIWEPLGTPPSVEAELFLKVTFSVGCRNLACFVFLNNWEEEPGSQGACMSWCWLESSVRTAQCAHTAPAPGILLRPRPAGLSEGNTRATFTVNRQQSNKNLFAFLISHPSHCCRKM